MISQDSLTRKSKQPCLVMWFLLCQTRILTEWRQDRRLVFSLQYMHNSLKIICLFFVLLLIHMSYYLDIQGIFFLLIIEFIVWLWYESFPSIIPIGLSQVKEKDNYLPHNIIIIIPMTKT